MSARRLLGAALCLWAASASAQTGSVRPTLPALQSFPVPVQGPSFEFRFIAPLQGPALPAAALLPSAKLAPAPQARTFVAAPVFAIPARSPEAPLAVVQLEGLQDPKAVDAVWLNARAAPIVEADDAVEVEEALQAERPGRLLRALPSLRRASAAAPKGPPAPGPRSRLDRFVESLQAKLIYERFSWSSLWYYLSHRPAKHHETLRRWEAETKGRSRAVQDLEGVMLAWRAKAYMGVHQPMGPWVADPATSRREALAIWDAYYPPDPAARAAFLRYLDRVDQFAPKHRRSFYRKHAFRVFEVTPTVEPERLVERLDALLGEEELRGIEVYRRERQPRVLEDFRRAALEAIDEVNAGLEPGRRVLGVLLLGSFAGGNAAPGSDLDYQVLTEDGGAAPVAQVIEAVDRRWAVLGHPEPPSPYQYALPPNRTLLHKMHREGYLLISPYEEATRALAPPDVQEMLRAPPAGLRGKLYEYAFTAYFWTAFRVLDLKSRS
ncbi:MAG TPA: hypothetical protein DCM05_03535 [Elusimicrobia bacterium]|nr:hypothetical protein [Elusimicrobiota bacterium]